MFWPAKLAVFYPYTSDRLLWEKILIAFLLLAGVTVVAFVLRKRFPYFITGWLWYLVMLLPVIGVIQVGAQARADRYTYLPHIGLYLVVTWGIVDLTARWRYRRQVLAALAGIAVVTLTWRAWVQTTYWRNSESLWTHALAVTSNNATAHNNLGLVFQQRGHLDDAIAQYHRAVATSAGSNYDTNSVAVAHNNLGFALLQKAELDAAAAEFEKAVKISPNYADAHFNLGNARFEKDRVDDAIVQWEKTLSIQADDAEAHTNIGRAFFRKGQIDQAVAHYKKALEIAPHSIWASNDLAWIFATCSNASFRNGPEAVAMAQRALQVSGAEDPTVLRTLAAAYAESGRFSDAIEAADRALGLARRQSDFALTRNLQEDVDLYRTSSPLRDTRNVESQK
jgi:tetratricopeptide (TPR) repeat protein